MQYWEDLEAGASFSTNSLTISAAEIIAYAEEFDPQPYHLDPVIAESSIFGGHCASGWQVCALMMRIVTDTMLREQIPTADALGVDSLKWLKPVFADDSLHARITLSNLQLSDDYPDYGLIDFHVDVANQNDDSVVTLVTTYLVERQSKGETK